MPDDSATAKRSNSKSRERTRKESGADTRSSSKHGRRKDPSQPETKKRHHQSENVTSGKEKSSKHGEHHTSKKDEKEHKRRLSKSSKNELPIPKTKKETERGSRSNQVPKSSPQNDHKKHSATKKQDASDKAKPSISTALGKVTIKQEERNSTQHAGYEYEDDFEDYSEDFEEDSSGERESAQGQEKSLWKNHLSKSIESEGRPELAIGTSDSPLIRRILQSRDADTTTTIGDTPNRFIDFSRATESSFGSLTADRHGLLKNLLGMEIVRYDFADIPPVNDYEFYIQMFGNTDRVQVQTQTHDEDCCRTVQTEDEECESKWTQHPPIDELGWGIGSATAAHLASLDIIDTDVDFYRTRKVDADKLKKFLSVAGEVVVELTAKPSQLYGRPKVKHSSKISFSTGYSLYSAEKISTKSSISFVIRYERRLFVAFYVTDGNLKEILDRTLIIEYSVENNDIPQRIMICENELTCCCFVPANRGALFAGLKDGSCVAFDLSEPSSVFSSTISWPHAKEDFALYTPAYDTAFRSISSDDEQDSRSPVVSISATVQEPTNISTYQLASINEVGSISVWTVSEAEKGSSNVDLGLRPGAVLKMSMTSIIRLNAGGPSQPSGPSSLSVRSVAYDPLDPFHFFIGTDNKVIFNFTRSKGLGYSGPRIYKANGLPAEVTCQKFSPFDAKIFAAGLSTGQLLFFKTDRTQPILTLDSPDDQALPVTHIEFSPCNGSTLYTVHQQRFLCTWNLVNGTSPLSKTDIYQCCSAIITTVTAWSDEVPRDGKAAVFLALGLSNGELQVHSVEEDSKFEPDPGISTVIEELARKIQ